MAVDNSVLKTLESYARLKTETNVIQTWLGAANADYQTVKFPDGDVAFRIDTQRGLVDIKRRGQCYYFDLARIVSSTGS